MNHIIYLNSFKIKMVRCKICNRVLKNEDSIERGYGLTCYKKHNKTSRNSRNLRDFLEYK